ncbi:MAG TPA: L-threonylcarbamoyladenylate synthase [Chthoniobacterales bacterium]|nr:L-threonylcarbamoyladenylate synthase [Chthoniobacterales bacterium]
MRTKIVSSLECAEAVTLLHAGEIVGLPTETVYGLAADALNPIAVAKIFEAKDRPRFDPLIVHLPDPDWLKRIADLPSNDRPLILKLVEKFWPGPFTMVLPKREIVPEIVTAGLDTVAVRMSAHPVFAEIVRVFGKPLAAPSANRFGRISPTTAQHVQDELGGRIPLIINAGPTEHGIESTIITIQDGKIDILRRGPISAEQLSGFGTIDIARPAEKVFAPGQLPSHYAPKTPLRLVEDFDSFLPKPNQHCALLAWNAIENDERFIGIRNLSEGKDLREAAANLFRCLRELDALDADLIVAEPVPDQGLGAAIMDRMRRASRGSLDAPDKPG